MVLYYILYGFNTATETIYCVVDIVMILYIISIIISKHLGPSRQSVKVKF